jgi:nitroreductase
MNAVIQNIMVRKSVRNFTNEKLAREDLELLTLAALNAPSGNNRQQWKFTVVQNPEAIKKLAAVIAKQVGRAEGEYDFYKPNALIIASVDRTHPLGLEDCACALQSIFLAATSLGIGSVWINQLKGICDETAVREVLNAFKIPPSHVVYGTAALGRPAENLPPKNERKQDVVEWIL